jgi:hypothetical protein
MSLLAGLISPVVGSAGITPFSSMAPGPVSPVWELVELRGQKPTEFEIVEHEGERVLEARADASAAALSHQVDISAALQPVLHWRWKISAYIDGADISTKEGDDYPARVYVTFARDSSELSWLTRIKLRLARMIYGADVPVAALCYVWDQNSSAGLSLPNAYTGTVQMIVVENGATALDTWISESRDVYADYRDAFGGQPPSVNSVIVGVDTDNTGEAVTTWFGDLYFSLDEAPPE